MGTIRNLLLFKIETRNKKIWVILKMGADTFLLFKTKNRYENIGHIENGYVLYRVYNLKY